MTTEPQISSKVYDVEIGGLSLQLKSDHQPDKVNKLIQLVESKVTESLKNHSNISAQKALILSCLSIAEDFSNLKEKACSKINKIESKMQSISTLLESSKQKASEKR